MKKLYLIFSLVFTCLISNAQLNFQSGFGDIMTDYGTKVVKTSDGNYCIVGSTGENQTDGTDIAVYFVNQIGEMNSSVLIGLDKDDTPTGLVETSDGGFIISGTSNTTLFGSLNTHIFALKINSLGDVLWSNVYSSHISETASSLFKTPEGNFIIVGSTSDLSQCGYPAALALKINENGDQIWCSFSCSGFGCYFNQGDLTFDNQYIFAGGAYNGNNNDIFYVKLDTSGNMIWSRRLATQADEWISDIKTTSDSGFIMAGISTVNTAGDTDQCIIKTDTAGIVTWAYNYGTTGYDRSFSVVENSIHHYGVCGLTNVSQPGSVLNQMVIEELDNIGNVVWANIYGDSVQTSEGYYLINGIDDGFAALGFSVAYGEPNGDVDFVKTDNYGGSGCDEFPLFLTQNVPTFTDSSGGTQNLSLLDQQTAGMTGSDFTNSYAQNCVYDYIKIIPDRASNDNLINLYPNPTDKLLNIDIETDEANVIIYDQLGRNVFEQKINSSKTTIDVSFLSPGFYYLELRSGNDFAKGIFVKN